LAASPQDDEPGEDYEHTEQVEERQRFIDQQNDDIPLAFAAVAVTATVCWQDDFGRS